MSVGPKESQMDTLQDRIGAKDAVDAAFRFFRELFGGTKTSHVLLEGLEYDERDDRWRVVIGFDTGRHKETNGSLLATMGQKTTEPISELRTIYVNARDGTFVSMHRE
jgi:hypothetical protein